MNAPTIAPDNLAIAYLARRLSPTLTPSQLDRAVRIEDRRDTLGRKRAERTRRVAWSPACDRAEPAPEQLDLSPLLQAVCARLERAGLSALVPHLMAGLTVSEAAREAGIPERTARHKLAAIRENLSEFLAVE